MYIRILIVSACSFIYAWDLFSSSPPPRARAAPPITQHKGPPPICLSNEQKQKQNRYTCPKVNELYQKGLRWRTDSGWKSYQESFSSNISHFMGAQWKGVGVGNIYCIYQPEDPTEFPIQVTISQLISRPDTARWDDAPSRDVLNCISQTNDPCECQFSYYVEEETGDIDDIISGIEKVY